MTVNARLASKITRGCLLNGLKSGSWKFTHDFLIPCDNRVTILLRARDKRQVKLGSTALGSRSRVVISPVRVRTDSGNERPLRPPLFLKPPKIKNIENIEKVGDGLSMSMRRGPMRY